MAKVPRQISDDERERRRDLAKQLHAEGRFGGPQPGSGRPRKIRASEKVAEAAKDEAETILQVFKDAIDPEQPISVRLKAARDWLDIEVKEEALTIQEERALEGMHRDTLVAELAQRMSKLIEKGVLDQDVIDSVAFRELPQGES